MRFLIRMFTVLVLMLIGMALLYLGYTEGRLRYAAWTLSNDYGTLKRLAVRPEHMMECAPYGAEDFSGLYGYQLRFSDETHYVIEALCGLSGTEPILVKEATLPFGVKKILGPGLQLVIPSETIPNGAVLLKGDLRDMEVGLKDETPYVKVAAADDWFNVGESPAYAQCSEWGFICCGEREGQGSGWQAFGVKDCSSECYQTCQYRPQVIHLNSDPFMNAQTRELRLAGPAAQVGFSVLYQDIDGTISKVVIDFGDGASESIDDMESLVQHTYACSQSTCNYIVRVAAQDNEALWSMESRISQLHIVMTNQAN